ncbi:hypothetical protein [Cohnella lupini]|nr:hypothetical protein [Cohnella lupini]
MIIGRRLSARKITSDAEDVPASDATMPKVNTNAKAVLVFMNLFNSFF